jgi:alkylation response protein AidB-like acyl-CoA dehydrogenase
VKERYVLGRPIPRYAAIAERLARVGRQLEAARSSCGARRTWRTSGCRTRRRRAWRRPRRGRPRSQACIEAISICGAHGTLSGDDALLEKWFRDIKVYDIFEGTGNIQRIVISKRILTDLRAF